MFFYLKESPHETIHIHTLANLFIIYHLPSAIAEEIECQITEDYSGNSYSLSISTRKNQSNIQYQRDSGISVFEATGNSKVYNVGSRVHIEITELRGSYVEDVDQEILDGSLLLILKEQTVEGQPAIELSTKGSLVYELEVENSFGISELGKAVCEHTYY